MALRLFCERCYKHIVTLPAEKVAGYISKHGEVCAACMKKEDALISFFDKQKEKWIKDLGALKQRAIDDLQIEIERLTTGGSAEEKNETDS